MRTLICRFSTSVLAAIAVSPAFAELPAVNPSQELTPLPSESGYPSELLSPTFGRDVAVDGSTAVVGMTGTNNFQGSAAVFTRNASGQWVRTATLRSSTARNFGRKVAVAGGRILAASQASIYLFTYSSGAWRQTWKIGLGSATHVRDIDFNGSLAVVSATDTALHQKVVHVFRLTADGQLKKIGKLAPPDATFEDDFGAAVAATKTTVAIGAPGLNDSQSRGAAYVYNCGESYCWQAQKLIASDGDPGDAFGSALDIRGNQLVVGAPFTDTVIGDPNQPPSASNSSASGAAYVFVRPSGGRVWREQQRLRPTADEANRYFWFGTMVEFSSDRLLVGAIGGSPSQSANAFVYAQSTGLFNLSKRLVAPNAYNAAAFSGTTVMLGNAGRNFDTGVVYVFNAPR